MISKYLSILLMATATLNPLSLAEELSPSANAEPPTQNSQLPTVPNFRLLDQNGRSHELYRCAEAPAVVLYTYGLGCPIVRQSAPNLWRIQEEFEPKGVRFFLLNANAGDTRDEITADAQEFAIQAPILQDEAQAVTRALGSKRTAEAILIDPKSGWKIVYRGAVDDRFDYGAQKQTKASAWSATSRAVSAPSP
ncbi:MAG: redoxin family protein [Candidatus Hydrogenedentes bacterium]|nr:redoxin family protein [Candidatus Hydrogenedentota bacterium]